MFTLMVDQNSIFGGMLTTLGVAKKTNCDALGIPWEPRYMLIGDANGTDPVPSPAQTKLINQRYRAQLNQLRVSPTDDNVLIAELVLPPDVGGWWIRELALEDKDGVFSAVANVAPSYKPLLAQGSGRNQVVRMHVITSGTSNIQLKIDPSVVLATREYVDTRILEELNKLDNKQSVRAATTANIALAGLQTVDGVLLATGDRVLVKNQAVAKDNGIWVASVGGWARAADADVNAEVTSALLVSVEQGTTLADTRWQLVTDGTIVLGTTALTFQNVTQGLAPINSPALINPTANTPPLFDSSMKIATTEFAQRAQGNFAGRFDISALPATLSIAAAGHRIVLAASGTLTLPLVNSVPTGTNFFLFNTTPGVVNIIRQGTDVISAMSVNSLTSVTLQSLSTIVITAGNGQWVVEDGMSAMKYAPEFGSYWGSAGYHRLPSGAIEQWGSGVTDANGYVYVTFPIPFPNAPRNITPMHVGSLCLQHAVMGTGLRATGCTLRVQNAAGAAQAEWTVWWRAIGN
ncbi:phage tail protein [Pseudomonas sp. SCPG-7]|uniref:phage tail protein n=1 Tax=Pseudomonas sp. SCPG-7 TaxID=1961714 RepID=UPI0021143D64|nr:phage tail protein [Pseudomonas sp. SCPG-7]